MAKEGNGKVKKELKLTNEERLEISNINLQRQLLDQQVKNEINMLDRKQSEIAEKVNTRLDIDLKEYSINLDTGVLQEPPQQEKAAN